MTKRIYMTGVMGSGKTSVAKMLSKMFYGSLHQEEINSFFLDNVFSSSPNDKMHKVVSQTNFLLDLIKAHNYKLVNRTQVFDTSSYTNLFFTEHLLGEVPQSVLDLVKYSDEVSKNTSDNVYHVFLFCSFDKMMERIKIRGRDYENTTEFDYRSYYDTFIKRMHELEELNYPGFISVNTDEDVPEEIASVIYNEILAKENI